jgi:hypothetical protein
MGNIRELCMSRCFDPESGGCSDAAGRIETRRTSCTQDQRRAELAPEIATALEAIVEAVQKLDGRLSVLEGKGRIHPTAEMSLPKSSLIPRALSVTSGFSHQAKTIVASLFHQGPSSFRRCWPAIRVRRFFHQISNQKRP